MKGGDYMDNNKNKLFEHKEQKSRSETATKLRQLADQIEQGTVTLQDGSSQATLQLPETISMELEAENKTKDNQTEHELEIEFKWMEGSQKQ